MKEMHMLAFGLVIVGALNHGIYGLGWFVGMDVDLIYKVFGSWPMIESLVYVLIGIAAVMLVVSHKQDCKHCSVSAAPSA